MSEIAQYRSYELPWTTAAEQERAFRKILGISVVTVVLFALALSLSPIPQLVQSDNLTLPTRSARLILELPKPAPPPKIKQPPKPAAPQPAKPATPPKAEKPKPATAAKPEPRPKRAALVQQSRPITAAPKAVQVDEAARINQARKQASTAGLLAIANQLDSLRDTNTVATLAAEPLAGGRGSGNSHSTAPVVQRSIITSKAGRGSSGIVTAPVSRSIGGGAVLAGRTTTRVANPLSGLAAAGGTGEAGDGTGSQDGRPARSREEIERVFDKNKGAIYALYNRALRQNPALQGKVVLRLTIDPGGHVSECVIVSSELGDSTLEEKLVQRIRLFAFEARDVAPTTITKPIDFFPA